MIPYASPDAALRGRRLKIGLLVAPGVSAAAGATAGATAGGLFDPKPTEASSLWSCCRLVLVLVLVPALVLALHYKIRIRSVGSG